MSEKGEHGDGEMCILKLVGSKTRNIAEAGGKGTWLRYF